MSAIYPLSIAGLNGSGLNALSRRDTCVAKL